MKLIKMLASLMAFGFLMVAVTIAAAAWYLNHEFKKPGPLAQETFVIVQSGEGLSHITENLAGKGAIDNPLVFKTATRISGAQSDLKAGEYRLAPHMSAKEIMYMMKEGLVYQRKYTVREGLTSYEVVRVLKGVPDLTGEIIDAPKEGTLLPETYSYQKGDTRLEQLHNMQQAMDAAIEDLWPNRSPDLPFQTKEEAITLASIVEKETGVPEERKRVAGVFINRLKRGIALQTDPTVIYAITGGRHENEGQGPLGRRLLKKDLEFDSPYNTYKYPGLPPGPIANPGRASIEAVLNPEQHDYIYFVADGTGGHLFASSLDEHNRNVANWRKIRRNRQ